MKERTYSKNIANAINNFLTEDDWRFSFDEQRGLFEFGLCLKGKVKKIRYIVDVKEDEYLVYAISPLGADDDDETMMASMAEFVCRANYGLKNGNFELDMRDGEIRFKSFVDCEGITPTAEIVKNSIYCPAAMFDRYSAGIVGIIFNGSTAKDAIAQCEKSPAEELRALLGDDLDGDEEMAAMLTRLAARLGVDESGLRSDHEPPEPAEDEADVKTELFDATGGAV